MIQYKIEISGRVQGVGFRYFTQKKAKQIGLLGWVKNTYSGTVEVMVQGSETEIQTFLDFLQIGPSLSRVDKISKYKMEVLNDFDSFKVKY